MNGQPYKETIQRKLNRVILFVCATALLIVAAVLFVFHTSRVKQSVVSQTQSLCRMVAENTKAALEFDSPSDAKSTLSGLAAQPEFSEAAIYDRTGTVFASFSRDGESQSQRPQKPRTGYDLKDSELVVFEPITMEGAKIGTVYARRECREINEQVTLYVTVGSGLLVVVLTIAYVLARHLQGPITKPILELAKTATNIAQEKDYSVRVKKTGDDEIGVLFDGFNSMLAEIEGRDLQLEKHRRELESRVESRTNELRASETRYRMLFESNPLPMWVYDIETRRFLAVNESAVNHYGYTRAEFLSMTVDDARVEEDSGTHYRMNGNAIQVETIGHSLVFENRPARLVSISDVTARRKAERELKNANEKLLDASRRAGMAEVATGVLHNVGNVLNSVNVAATIIAERTQSLRVESLSRAATLIGEKGTQPEFFASDQGRAVPGFLKKLADHFGTQREFLCSEIQALTRNVDHIKQIVAMQQSYASTAGVIGPVNACELVDDALKLVSGSLGRHKIDVTRSFQEAPPIHTDRHRVLQILVNLIRNAGQAMRDVDGGKRITVGIESDEKFARISVADNGIGISEEHIKRIFNHGFTTKQDGHGFGLHSGALAAKELGGSLSVKSPGLGRGATFTLELPILPINR